MVLFFICSAFGPTLENIENRLQVRHCACHWHPSVCKIFLPLHDIVQEYVSALDRLHHAEPLWDIAKLQPIEEDIQQLKDAANAARAVRNINTSFAQ